MAFVSATFLGNGANAHGIAGGEIIWPAPSWFFTRKDSGGETFGQGPFDWTSNGYTRPTPVDPTKLTWSGWSDYSMYVPGAAASCTAAPLLTSGDTDVGGPPNGRTLFLYPGGFSYVSGGPTTGYSGSGGPQYGGISDLSLYTAGAAAQPFTSVAQANVCGAAWSGTDAQATGGVTMNTLSLSYPVNTVLAPAGGGILDFNNLPTFSVVSTTGPCGTSGYTFGITGGTLPLGMSLNATTGALTGTPTGSGPYAFSVYAEKKSPTTYCWGKVDYAGVVIVGSGGVVFDGTSFGPLYINAIPQWQVHRFDLRQRPENKS